MAITPFGVKINTWVTAADGDTYGDAQRFFLRGYQALAQANVISMAVSAQPGAPTNADTYVIGPAPSGAAWGGKAAGTIAYWAVDSQDDQTITPNVKTGAWEFYVPMAGWEVYDNNTSATWTFNGTLWVISSARKQVLAATTTTTLSPASWTSFAISVGVAVTSIVFNAGGYDGQEIEVLWLQDVTGHAVSGFAANIHGTTAVNASANMATSQKFTWNLANTTWYAVAAGVVQAV